MTAARAALARGNVGLVLPYVHADGEAEVREAFDRTMTSRALGRAAQDVSDRWFFETVVRIHRAGEGATFTGLKPAGLDVGPVIPTAERALESGSADELVDLLCGSVRDEVVRRHAHAMELKEHAGEGIPAARAYVDAMLGLQVWAHKLHGQIGAPAHAHAGAHEHG